MKAELKLGKRWNHISVVGTGTGEHVIFESDGFKESERDTWFDLQCGCGEKFRVWRREWPGIKNQPDCGCGIAKETGNVVILTASISMELKKRLSRYAREQNVSVSMGLREILKGFFEGQGGEWE
jgi:hypothetical protein